MKDTSNMSKQQRKDHENYCDHIRKKLGYYIFSSYANVVFDICCVLNLEFYVVKLAVMKVVVIKLVVAKLAVMKVVIEN